MNAHDFKPFGTFGIVKSREVLGSRPVLRGWEECVAKAQARSIYSHPDWVLSSCDNKESLIYLRPHRGEQDGALECLAVLRPNPVHLGRRAFLAWLLSLNGFKLVGDQLLGETDRASTGVFLSDLLVWLNSGATEAECIFFEDIEIDSPLWNCLEEVREQGSAILFQPSPPQVHWWIQFSDPPTAYWNRFSGKTWSDVRSKARKLRHSVVCFTRSDQVPEFLAKAHEVSKQSWQAKRLGLRIQNSPEERQFFEFLAAHGVMRCYILEQDGKPLAFEFGYQWNGCFVFEETGYDLAYAQYSPGMVLIFRVLEDLTSRDTPSLCDFGSGDAPYKQFWGTRQTSSGPVLLVRRGKRTLTVLGLQKLGRSLGRSALAALKKVRLASYARRIYRK